MASKRKLEKAKQKAELLKIQLEPYQEILEGILPSFPRLASIVTHAVFGARAAVQQGARVTDGILFGIALESAAHSSFASSVPGGAAIAVGYGKLAIDQFAYDIPEILTPEVGKDVVFDLAAWIRSIAVPG